MRKEILCGLALVCVIGLVALPALAKGAGHSGGRAAQVFKQADANNDGQVTFDELKAVLPNITSERFARLDRNGDGVLTKADRAAAGASKGAAAGGKGGVLAKLRQADTNGDRQVSLEEAQAVLPQLTEERFRQFDHNGDGVISREDIQQVLVAKLKQADQDGDGKISLAEAQTAMPRMTAERFQRLDRNGDGYLSTDDRQH